MFGGIPEWPKGPDCKSGGNAFAGSNPAPAIALLSSTSAILGHGHGCGCSSMVEFQPSKLATWVRFPSPALGSAAVAQLVECVLGKDEVLGSNPSSSLTGVLPVR